MSGIRVLVWCPVVNPGGAARLLSQLLPALARQPEIASVRLAAPIEKLPSALRECQTLELFDLAPPANRTASWLQADGRIAGIRGTGRMKRALRRYVAAAPPARGLADAAQGCDVVYAPWPQGQPFPRTDLPIVCTIQDLTLLEFPEMLGGREAGEEWSRTQDWLEGCAEVVVSSRATITTMRRQFGGEVLEPGVIHHAVLPDTMRPGGKMSDDLARRLPPRYVLFPANIAVHKNHYNLLAAWSRFELRAEFPLVLVGAGTEALNLDPFECTDYWQQPRLTALMRRHGLRRGVDYQALGYVADDDVMPLTQGATALVMPTLAEGGGSYPVEEALACGVPVACSDIPVLREHVADRTAEFAWFDPESVDSILAALRDLFDRYDIYRRAAVAAMSDPRPGWDDVARGYAAVLARAASQAARTAVAAR